MSEREELADELYRAYNEGDPQDKVPFLSIEARLHLADALLSAGYRKTREPEYEYSAGYPSGSTLSYEPVRDVTTDRKVAELYMREDDGLRQYGALLRRDRRFLGCPWLPVDAGPQQDEGEKQ